MSEEKPGVEAEEGKNSAKKLTRREALKRIALSAGGIGLLGTIPSWAAQSLEQNPKDSQYPPREQVAAYYSWYSRYVAYYKYIYTSIRYSSYYSYKAPYYSYISYVYRPGGSPGGTCFIDTLEKKKK